MTEEHTAQLCPLDGGAEVLDFSLGDAFIHMGG